jgi:hypothetical protein
MYTGITLVSSDISDDTMLYFFGPRAAGVTTYVGLSNLNVDLTMSSIVQQPLRNFGQVYFASYYSAILAGANTPAEWREIYNVPDTATDAAAGLLASPAYYVPADNFNYSPDDLATANAAFDTPVPDVSSVTLPPVFPANNPAAVYSPVYAGQQEAALNIQMLTQYGAGSGAEFGFAASSNNTELDSLGYLGIFL